MGLWKKLFGTKKSTKKTTSKGSKKKATQKGHKTANTGAKKKTTKKANKNTKKTNNTLKDAQKAYKKGKDITYLGTKQKTTYTDLGKKKHATGRAKAQGNDRDKLKSVNALTKSEFERMVSASRLGKEQGNKLLKGGKRTGQKDIREKVGSKTAESAYKSKAATGVMQGMSKADIFSNSVGTYNKEAKKAIKKTKESTAYNIGYGAGMAADMAMGGIGSKGASAAELTGKAVAKAAAKAGVKTGAKKSTKSAVKTFAKNRAGELVAETPSNLLDAAKMSQDTNGKIDKKEFAKYAAINTGLTTGVGGAIEGVGVALTKKQVKRATALLKKQKSGTLTEEEAKELKKLTSKIDSKSKSEIETASAVTAEKSDVPRQYKTNVDNAKVDQVVTQARANAKDRAETATEIKRNEMTNNAVDNMNATARKQQAEVDNVANAKDLQTQAKSLPSRAEIQSRVKEAESRLDELKSLRESATTEEQARMLDNSIAKVEDEITALRKQEGVVWNAEKSVEKYGDLTTEKQPISATTKATDTPTPKVDKVPAETKSEAPTSIADEVDAEVKALEGEGVDVTPEVKKQIADEVEAEAKAIDEEIAAEKEIADEVKAETEEIEKQIKREPASVNKSNKDFAEAFDEEAKKGDYRAEAEKLIAENPKMGENAVKQNVLYYDTEELNNAFWDMADNGFFGKSKKVTQAEARDIVKDMAEKETLQDMANQFLGKDGLSDPHIFGAMAENLIPRLRNQFKETGNPADLELLMKVSDHANITVSQSASFTNAAKMWISMTDTGRVKAILKKIESLNNQYGDRLKKPLELTEDQKALIMKAETDEEIAHAVGKIQQQLWDQIPSTLWEKANALRHISMLLNFRTNVRNITGNGAFAMARAMSDGLEYVLTKALFKKTLEKNGADAIRATTGFASKEEKAASKPFIDEQFEKFYNSNSNKYKDVFDLSRPDDKTILGTKVGSAVEKFTYACLEKGDMMFFKPEYNKAYRRWCKNRGIDLTDLASMTETQKRQANSYAMSQAEKATFRETTKASQVLTKLKYKTATKTGRTMAGTAAYRAANVALESAMPFVKTPINVFRQSVDYSPIGLGKALAEMCTYYKRGQNELLEQGIHHLATGLTGSGITALGLILANKGLVQVKAGEKSGDAYYDRDMGYQDYSLIIGNKSFTIDWASPLQSSLFMGAQIFKTLEDNGIADMDARDIMNAMSSLLLPHLEASFMSGTADALEMFMQTAYSTSANKAKDENYNSGADWGGAILKTFGGTIPQNFVGTLLPFSQLSAQVAGALDENQRDTSSTKEGMLANSWESFARKEANRIPFIREALETKVDRRGNDVKSSPFSNPVAKMANALFNPSTVKEITFDKTDKELIDIYKNMPDGTTEEKNAKKYFFYNFTGKPSYDLEGDKEGQRMTYKEAHEYLVSSRKEQNNCIQDMLKAKSYKNMTYDMKADEVNSSYWISKAVADMETYSAKYACSALNRSSDKDAWKAYSLGNGSAKKFMDFYITKEKLVARAHDSGYNTKALAVVLANDKSITKLAKGAYNIYKSKLETAQAYVDAGGNFKEYTDASCNIMSKINKANTDKYPVTDSNSNKGVAAAYYKINKRTYAGLGLTADKANMGYWFKNNTDADGNKYTLRSLSALKAQGEAEGYDLGTKAGVTEYIESIGENMSQVEKACVFEYLDQHNSNNPYGAIPNYLGLKDSSSGGGGGGWGHGGWGHGGGGGSSSSTAPNEYKEYSYKKVSVKSGSSGTARNAFKTAAPTPGSSSVKKAKSGIDDAYKRKLQKYIDNLR